MTYIAPKAKQSPKPPQTGSVEAVKGFRETVILKDIIDSVVTELKLIQIAVTKVVRIQAHPYPSDPGDLAKMVRA